MFRPVIAATVVSLFLAAPVRASADVVLDWNAIAASQPAPNPFEGARRLAIAQLAVFEAVNAITGEYEPYLGTVGAAAGASPEAAAAQAAYRVLKTFNPLSATLDTQLATSLSAIPDGPAKNAGIATGEAAAAALLAARVGDGSDAPASYFPSSSNPGEWQLTTNCSAGLFFHWPNVTPFGIAGASGFILPAPPALGSVGYAKDYLEVSTVGIKTADDTARPQDRADVARFYAASSPGYVMSSAARQVAMAQQRSLSHNARTLAVMAMSINDSFIVSFATKYTYTLWRPETAIRRGDVDGNDRTAENAAFETYIATPCFPSYPSNHASGTNGGAEVLRRAYGEGEHVITLTNPAVPGVTLQYETFNEICNDVDDARVYGGIHFRFDQDAGNRVGRAVATDVDRNLLRRVHGH